MRKALLLLLLAAMLCTCALLLGGDEVILTATPTGREACGELRIPGAEIACGLYPVRAGGCDAGLYNGGRISARDADAQWQAVSVGDWMYIRQEDCVRLVLECVAVGRCLSVGGRLIGPRALLGHGGEVLLCVSAGCWPFVMVYRWTIL